jgi:hypothetical protein
MSPSNKKARQDSFPNSILICHLTTAHRSDDVRIFNRECRSLAKSFPHKITLAAMGDNPNLEGLNFLSLRLRPKNRIQRFFYSQYNAAYAVIKVRAHVWHIHDPELLPMAMLLIIFGKKVVWDSHEDYFRQFELHSQYISYLPKYLKKIVNINLNQFRRHYIQLTHSLKKEK